MFKIIGRLALASCLACLAASAAAQEEFPANPPTGAKLIGKGFKFPEGPAIDKQGKLYFSATLAGEIVTWDGDETALFTKESGGSNGLAIHKDGRIFGCGGRTSAILAFNPDGSKTVILDKVDGKPLNSPNDLVFDSKGNLYFTNPTGLQGAKPGASPVGIVRLDADGKAATVATGVAYPNGIDLSPDGKFLYVNDTMGESAVWRFPISASGEVGKGEVLHKFGKGACDGLAVAASGNLYVVLHLASKVVKLSPEGKVLKEYKFPKGSGVTNVCFGGADMKTLYITLGAKGEVYSLPADEPGLKLFSHK